jgi:hypothetical protein
MPQFQNRRKSDSCLNEIKLQLVVLLERTEVTITALKDNRDSHKILYNKTQENRDEISKLKTKQSIVTWVGGAFTLTGLGVIGRWVYKLIADKPPHL